MALNFVNRHVAPNEADIKNMLAKLGLASLDELVEQTIPRDILLKEKLKLSEPLSENEYLLRLKKLAQKNKPFRSLIGGGYFGCGILPVVVRNIFENPCWYTSYTPYQAEISQGTLQVMYEFQTMISRLTGMDVSNATVYDGGTACAEAILMAKRITKKSKALVSENLNPEYKKVIDTYAWANEIQVEYFNGLPIDTSDYACVLVQNPDYYGEILEVKPLDTLLIVCTNISSLSILKPPSEYGADIVVGDIQTLGIPQEFGGPHAGFIACREKYMRQIPGRLAGRTVDADGNQAFCLTIQTREQHIKREKATSNICSNQALIGLCATLYLSLLGEKGFKQVGYLSAKQAHKLSQRLSQKGIKTLNKNFFNEFVIEVNSSADEFLRKLKENSILGGIKLDEKRILVAATEMISDEDIEKYLQAV